MKIIQEIDVDKNIDIGSSIYQRDRYLSRKSANHRKKNDQANLRERTMTYAVN